MSRFSSNFTIYLKKLVKTILSATFKRLFPFFEIKISSKSPVDIFSQYSFITDKTFENQAAHLEISEKARINWVVPDFNPGSGGHINIFRIIDNLEKQGFQCSVTITGNTQFLNASSAKAAIHKYFRPIQAEIFLNKENIPPACVTFATSWSTAYFVKNFQSTQYKGYFVQDFEPYFYAHSSEYYWAEDTYRFGFYGITAGSWLAQKLSRDYGMKTDFIGFSYDKELYRPIPQAKGDSVKKIFFYARPVTPRRGFELGLLALEKVAQNFPDVEFVLAGWDTTQYRIPFKHSNLGVVPLTELPAIYSQCYAALVLSFTNLSLLPLELIACKCPVVSNRGANVEWLLNDNNALLVDTSVESLSEALNWLLRNPDERDRLSEQGFQFALSTNWEQECKRFSNYVANMVGQ